MPDPKPKRRWCQFSLRTLLVLTAVISLGLATHQWWQFRNRPLEWHPFTQATLDSHLADGQTVLVVFYSHWKPRPLWRTETQEVRLAIRRLRIATLVGNGWDGPGNPHDMALALEALGVDWSATPIVVMYRPDSDPAIVAGRTEYTDNTVAECVMRALKAPRE